MTLAAAQSEFKYFNIIVDNIEFVIDIIKFKGIIILKSGLF